MLVQELNTMVQKVVSAIPKGGRGGNKKIKYVIVMDYFPTESTRCAVLIALI